MTDVNFREMLRSELIGRLGSNGVIKSASSRDIYAKHVNPELARVFGGLGLDVSYVRGEGTVLYDAAGTAYLDFAGAYGALPLGHRPAAVWDAITTVGASAEPVYVQPSIQVAAAELARRLASIAPGDLSRVTFVNSGAEAIEIALKIARSATGRHGVLSTHDGFHGKTLGALSATGRLVYQQDFGAPVAGFAKVPYGDLDALADILAAQPDSFAAFVVEPIQAEGGVHVPPPGYMREAARLCRARGVLFVVDEVQTGFGRTGMMFCCEHDAVEPDLLAVAKALGGGVLPVGAVICRPELATESFALRHTSTFAGGTLVCRVGLAVLDALAADSAAVVKRAGETGTWLRDRLVDIADAHAGVVTDIRGRGLLLGIELTNDIDISGDQGFVASLAAGENLAIAVCSHLLGVERIRLAPTLFGSRVLRVEPPLTVTREECERFLDALDRTLGHVGRGDAAALLGHLVGAAPHRPASDERTADRAKVLPSGLAPVSGTPRFGFIVHPVDANGLVDFDPSLASFDADQCNALLRRISDAGSLLNPVPFIVGGGLLTSADGAQAYGELIGIPYTARQLLDLPGSQARRVVQEAVDLAVDRGAEVVGLGAYSSVVVGNAIELVCRVPVTTGNAFTAAASLRAVDCALQSRDVDPTTATACVIGASGAIGRACARGLARMTGRMLLVSSRRIGALHRLGEFAESLAADAKTGTGGFAVACSELSGRPDRVNELCRRALLVLSTDPVSAAREADILVTATSAPEPLVTAADLKAGAVICDVAQPPNVPALVQAERPDVGLFDGGIITLPASADFGLRYGLPRGHTYACMAETMLITLSGLSDLCSTGVDLRAEALERLGALADTHGFALASVGTYRADHL